MAESTAVTVGPTRETLTGVKEILMGPTGTGKTHSVGTLVDTGLEVFYLALEAGMESLMGYWTDRGKPVPDNLHWHRLAAPLASFNELIASAKNVNTFSYEALTKMPDPNRGKYNQFIALLERLNGFVDQRTGKSYGKVNEWGTDKCLVIDGLTGIANCAMNLVIGGKPVRSQSDWGIAQDQVEKILRMLCEGCACHFVLLAHVERETDLILGGSKLMMSSLGKALSPKIPIMFSDVILSVRTGSAWSWDTASALADVKTRNLPVAANIPPSFGPVLAKWKSRNAAR